MTTDDRATQRPAGASSADRTDDTGRIPRRVLLAGTGAAGLLVGAGATESANLLARPDRVMQPVTEIPPSEDLMREHGILKRVLLVYREAIRRLDAGSDLPTGSLHQAAAIVHEFIEGFHEGLEEAYVFPRLRAAGKHVDTVQTLLIQHARGRRITQSLLADVTDRGLDDAAVRHRLAHDMAAFIRMYEPHEAREDTVIFPAFRAITADAEFARLGERFAELETRQFGTDGFTDIVTRIAEIERSFGIYDLNKFTPPP